MKKLKTNMRCSCGYSMEPTDDFFVWKCTKCAWSWVIQMSPQFIPEKTDVNVALSEGGSK